MLHSCMHVLLLHTYMLHQAGLQVTHAKHAHMTGRAVADISIAVCSMWPQAAVLN